MGLFQFVQDWQMVKREKAGILDALRQTRPGGGITIKIDADPKRREIQSRAVIELLKEHANFLEVVDYGQSVSIVRKPDMLRSVSRAEYDHLAGKADIFAASGLDALGLLDGHELPVRPGRGGALPGEEESDRTLDYQDQERK